ncbi:MAG: hypothetical protein K2N78_01170 [Oscillospiraceae bacterium]|nr:hypothetical protein [Oscillospiraceae bacterium]
MKKARNLSFLALLLAVLLMAVNMFALPLPDWAVRAAGVVMLLALPCMAYSIVKGDVER